MEGGCPLCGIVLTDDKGLSRCKVCFNFLLGKVQTVLIINTDFLALYHLCL